MGTKVMARAGSSLRQNVSQPSVARNFLSQPSGTVEMTPEMQASVILDMALLRMWGSGAGKQVSLALGVSESLVSRWRNAEHRELPSLGQVTALGPVFLRIFHKEQSKFYGFSRQALLDLITAVEDMAAELSA